MALQDKENNKKNKPNRTIVLPLTESDYHRFMDDLPFAHQKVRHHFQTHPELFPPAMAQGYAFNGTTRVSKKLKLKMRKLKINNHQYQIRPSFVLPYMRGMTDEVEKGLFLLRFSVPFWALAFVFGRNHMYWYRLFLSFSTYSLVGTTLRKKETLPEHVLADEHHIRVQGQKAYVATTVGKDCILGVQAVEKADTESLKAGYKTFKEEAQALDGDYQPQTVNTDGWAATQGAWRALFPKIFIIECFLHAFLKVRDRATKSLQDFYHQAAEKVWHIYRAKTKRSMGQRIRRLGDWTRAYLPDVPMKENLLKLCDKRRRWLAHIDFPNAFRTSATLDRLMKFMERHAIAAQMFHSHHKKTTQNIRAYALLYNFTPSCPAVLDNHPTLTSPAARANHFVYHQNWLQNLLINTSLGGYWHHCKTL